MNTFTGRAYGLRRLADLWPYLLIAISFLGLVLEVYRGTN